MKLYRGRDYLRWISYTHRPASWAPRRVEGSAQDPEGVVEPSPAPTEPRRPARHTAPEQHLRADPVVWEGGLPTRFIGRQPCRASRRRGSPPLPARHPDPLSARAQPTHRRRLRRWDAFDSGLVPPPVNPAGNNAAARQLNDYRQGPFIPLTDPSAGRPRTRRLGPPRRHQPWRLRRHHDHRRDPQARPDRRRHRATVLNTAQREEALRDR